MADDILRLRTVVVSDEALANIRAVGRELQVLPRQAERGIQQVNREFQSLGQSIRNAGTAIRSTLPGFGAFSLGAAGLGLVATQAVRSIGEITKSIVDLQHTSRELGLSTQQIRGFMTAAERAGVEPQAMLQGMQAFRKNTEDFAMRIGATREQMQDVGFGRLLARINAASTEMDKYKAAWEMAEVLGRNSAAAKRLFDMLGIGADKLRFTFDEIKGDIAKAPIVSEKQFQDAKRYNDLMIDLARSFDLFKQRQTLSFFDKIEEDKKNVQWLVDKFKELEAWTDRIRQKVQEPPGPGGGMQLPPSMFRGRGRGRKPPSFQHGGVFTGGSSSGSMRGAAGNDILRGSEDTLTTAYREGTFQGLMQYASYQQAARGGGGLGSGTIAGGRGGGGGTGGYGGRGGLGGLGGSERSSGSSVTPSDNEKAAAAQGPLLGMPQYPGVPGTTPGAGAAGPLGLPATPGAPATPVGGAPGTPGAAGTGGVGGAALLAERRKQFAQELDANPKLKEELAALSTAEGYEGKDRVKVVEALFNRVEYLKATGSKTDNIQKAMYGYKLDGKGFYGPINRGELAPKLAKLRANPAAMKAAMKDVDTALQGSDYAKGLTNQGMASDNPNYQSIGGEQAADRKGGNVYTHFGGGRTGPRGAKEWTDRRNAEVANRGNTGAPQTANAVPIPPLATGDPTVSRSDGERAAQGDSGSQYGGRVVEEQLRSGATRNKPIQPALRTALDYASSQTGLEVRVGSGGQIEGRDPHLHKRPGGWTGSHRHDLGHAADFRLYDKDGKAVPINDPRHIAFAEHAARAGAGGGGSGYMGGYTSHIDLGNRGGTYERHAAYNAAIARGVAARRAAGGRLPPAPTRRVDVANDARTQHPRKTGTVGVEVKSNGTEAKATAKTDGDLFDKTKIKTIKESQEAGLAP